MKLLQWLMICIGAVLIFLHGITAKYFVVDSISIVLFFGMSVPVLARYLRKAKVGSAEFEFKEEIRETEELVEASVEQAKKSEKAKKTEQGKPVTRFETFKLSAAKELLASDPVLALAALRIEIEKRVKSMERAGVQFGKVSSLSSMIKMLKTWGGLSKEQVEAIARIVNMCNKAIHGYKVSQEEAEEIIDLAEALNMSFGTGYSINMMQNEGYEKNGLLCEYEHCIEQMPITEEGTPFHVLYLATIALAGPTPSKRVAGALRIFPRKDFHHEEEGENPRGRRYFAITSASLS